MFNSVSIDDPKLLSAVEIALIDDPLYCYLSNDLAQRKKLIRVFAKGQFIRLANRYVGHQINDDLSAVALWLDTTKPRHKNWFESVCNQFSMLFSGSIKQIGKISAPLNQMERKHCDVQSQCQRYLSLIYVANEKRGQGLASELIYPTLSQIDSERLVCGVDTFNAQNVAIYQNYGFELVEKIEFNADLANYIMVRQPCQRVSE